MKPENLMAQYGWTKLRAISKLIKKKWPIIVTQIEYNAEDRPNREQGNAKVRGYLTQLGLVLGIYKIYFE